MSNDAINIKKLAFIEDPIKHALLGFELETQESEGFNSETRVDQDALDEAVNDEADNILSDCDFLENETSSNIDWNHILSKMSLEDALTSRGFDRIREHAYNQARDRIDESEYSIDTSEAFKNLDGSIEVGEDGSVKGFEFRTEGGLKFDKFMECANSVFQLDHEIDTECSFHIHVSIPGIEHQYGARFQGALMEGILNQWEFLPERVKTRLANTEQRNKYFGFRIKDDKYVACHKHSQGTWEFRLFGNVTDVEQAEACALIALEALRFAYRCQLGLETKTLMTETDIQNKLKNLLEMEATKGLPNNIESEAA